MIGYVPTALPAVAAVETVGGVVRLAAESPLTNPVYFTVSVGFAAPYARVLSSAVIVSVAGVTVSVPFT